MLSHLPVTVGVIAGLLVLSLVVFRGSSESMWANVLCTFVEASGLILVIVVGLRYWGSIDLFETPVSTGASLGALPVLLVLQGAVLTFYSFIGFEDTLN